MKLVDRTHPTAWKPRKAPPHWALSVGRRTQSNALGHITGEQNLANPTAEPVDHIFGFTGRERDEESALNYYRARYYDPTTGQFISQDPIGFEAGDANLYRYVENSPTNATDPSGLFPVDPPELELGHRTTGGLEKHSAAAHARRLQHQNALRKYAQETKNADVADALKHIDSAIADCEAARKTAERKMLRETARVTEYGNEMKQLTQSIERLKEIEIVVEHADIVDVRHLDDLPEPALRALTKGGRWVIGKKVVGLLPYAGIAAGVASYPEKVQAKGFYCGTLQAGLEEVPVVEWVMLFGGASVIPSDEYVMGMANVAGHPHATYETLHEAKDAMDTITPGGSSSWIDDVFELIDTMLGNFGR